MFFAVFVFSLFFGTVVYPVFDELESDRVRHHDFRVIVFPVFAHLCGECFIKNTVCSVARRDTIVAFHQFGRHILHACIALAFVQVERCRPGASAVALSVPALMRIVSFVLGALMVKKEMTRRRTLLTTQTSKVFTLSGMPESVTSACPFSSVRMLFVISAYGLLSEKPAMEIE